MAIEATPRNAAHLWRRAAFGASAAEIDQTVNDGIEATVAAMFDHRRAPAAGRPLRSPGEIAYDTEHLNLWFLRLAATSPTPAIERLMWFWHGYFATNLEKFEDPELLHAQLLTFRRHGLGRFDDLLKLMARDPAMILWLDLEKSVLGSPNENYARELMELFSLGVDAGYHQFDVVNGGRAFTGYTVSYEAPHQAVLNAGLHDTGVKTILGETGNFDGDDVVDLIVKRPECHRFVATRLWPRYAGTTPPAAVLDELAAVFARELKVRDLVVAMLTHPAFYADDVLDGLVAQPVETTINAIRGFGAELLDVTTTPILDDEEEDEDSGPFPWWVPLTMLEEMGQVVGLPPNVGGWAHNEPWLDATRAAGRLNAAIAFAEAITEAGTKSVGVIRAAADRSPTDAAAAIFSAFGITEWTAETGTAVATALTARNDDVGPLATAIAVAFTSPEVTLS
ncbi:MAG: DUF1800 domain-containing protein [Ilumatobacteraceae bacterium]